MAHKLFSGMTLTALGTVALLQTLGLYNFGLTLVPAILVWIGLEITWGSLFDRWGHPSFFGSALGLAVAGTGLAKILASAGLIAPMSYGELIRVGWPLLVVALGLSLLAGRSRWHWC